MNVTVPGKAWEFLRGGGAYVESGDPLYGALRAAHATRRGSGYSWTLTLDDAASDALRDRMLDLIDANEYGDRDASEVRAAREVLRRLHGAERTPR